MLRKRGLKRDKIKVKYVVTFVFESTLSECSTTELCPQQDVLLIANRRSSVHRMLPSECVQKGY